MTEDFSDHPLSIGELKADRQEDMRLWSARDIAISFLRDIDSGKIKPDAALILYRDISEDGSMATGHLKACPDAATALGLCSRVSHIINCQYGHD